MIDLEHLNRNQREALDDNVHEVISEIASDLNNAGPKAQVDYLLANGYSEGQIQEILDEADAPGGASE